MLFLTFTSFASFPLSSSSRLFFNKFRSPSWSSLYKDFDRKTEYLFLLMLGSLFFNMVACANNLSAVKTFRNFTKNWPRSFIRRV